MDVTFIPPCSGGKNSKWSLFHGLKMALRIAWEWCWEYFRKIMKFCTLRAAGLICGRFHTTSISVPAKLRINWMERLRNYYFMGCLRIKLFKILQKGRQDPVWKGWCRGSIKRSNYNTALKLCDAYSFHCGGASIICAVLVSQCGLDCPTCTAQQLRKAKIPILQVFLKASPLF